MHQEKEAEEALVIKTPECKFCFANYNKYNCQFYSPVENEFQVKVYRNGVEIVCECCDYSDDELEFAASCNSDDIPLKALLENSNSFSNTTESGMDVSKKTTTNLEVTEDTAPFKIQPGWYGKGWRRRKRKRTGNGC